MPPLERITKIDERLVTLRGLQAGKFSSIIMNPPSPEEIASEIEKLVKEKAKLEAKVVVKKE